MTLIEVIGVLTILAVLAGLILPFGIRYLDRVARDKETAFLQSLGDAFQKGILRTRAIPTVAQWPAFIAVESGVDLAAVTRNPRRNNRAFLFDKSGWFASGLPYTQTNASPPGLATLPASPRMMIVSSLGGALPADLNNDDPNAVQYFNDLWNTPSMSVPSVPPWVGWGGRQDDLIVQRVNIAPLFNRLVLSTYLGTNLGLYRVETNFYTAPTSNSISRFLLRNTPVDLFASAPTTNLNLSFMLDRDTSYVYENGTWRKSILGSVATPLGDSDGIVERFLRAPANLNALNTNPPKIQQQIIVDYFIEYMSNYNKWEDGSFTNTALKTRLNTIQPLMIDALEGLFESGGSTDYYPTNNDTCITLPP